MTLSENIWQLMRRVKRRLMPPSEVATQPEPASVEQAPVEREGWLMDGYSWIPDWKEILGSDWDEWNSVREKSKGGPKVLISTVTGGNSALTPLETLFAVALTLRGAEVHFLLCDKALPACQNCFGSTLEIQKEFVKNGPSLCDWCYETGHKSISQLGLPIHNISSWISDEDRTEVAKIVDAATVEEIVKFNIDGVNIGDIVESATLRYFGTSDFSQEELLLPVLKRYFTSSLLSNRGLRNLYAKEKFEHTVSNQGLYVPQANIIAIAQQTNSHVVAWDLAYRQLCINISHDETFVKTFQTEPTEHWENIEWNDSLENEIKEYLTGRWSGKFDWLTIITEGSDAEPDEIAKEIGLDPNKPTIGLLTNVIWDAQIAYEGVAFKDQLEWLVQTVEYFKKRPDLQLLIRVHPAEVKCWIESRQHAVDEIEKRCGKLTSNIFVIRPESKINTYKAMFNCNAVLVYGTTAGLEMACMRLPVIVAGQAWIRNKGISIDVTNPQEYQDALAKLPLAGRLADSNWNRAIKYAYHFYLRIMVPIGVLNQMPYENAPFKIKNLPLKGFSQGADPGLDVICKGILDRNEPFIFKAEEKAKQCQKV